ncbi:hypothetical protein HDK90DRAFT_488055 [Phyllosticta capitalensis]|uniref:NAD(P)-binding protein n=2 Tax=Phyllosticta capitalensis TaxID=121624 RepID=A0ABR1YPL0_9PEZI
MSNPVAIITGASSGIGLALTQHLLSKDWHIVLLDLNSPPPSASLPKDATLFIQCDVSSWDSQSSAFARAFEWRKRIDLAALNAGIDDRDDIFNTLPAPNGSTMPPPPTKPNMKTLDVDLYGVYYGIKLFAHYASLSPSSNKDIVVTASSAALYPLPSVPQYSTAKHGLLGLVRALAPNAAAHGFTINAICPDMIQTALAPEGLMENYPAHAKTPMSSMMRAYDDLIGLGAGGMEKKNGKVLEVVTDQLIYRDGPEPLSGKQGSEALGDILKLWEDVYRKRNVEFARKTEAEERAKAGAKL